MAGDRLHTPYVSLDVLSLGISRSFSPSTLNSRDGEKKRKGICERIKRGEERKKGTTHQSENKNQGSVFKKKRIR